jgi:hypothetical protein
LTFFNDVVSDNQALGEAGQNPFGAGVAAAGGVSNFGRLAVTATSFIRNLARGGDSNQGDFAGHAAGGVIANGGLLSIAGTPNDTAVKKRPACPGRI